MEKQDFLADRTASEMVRHLAETNPEQTAVETANRSVSYGELHRNANRLAKRLSEHLSPGSRVILRLFEMPELLMCSVALARTGMVAVPVDPTAPIDRLRAFVSEVGASAIYSDVPEEDETPDVPVINPSQIVVDDSDEVADYPDVPIGPNDLVSIVFTSGSTGTPKGVMTPAAALDSIPHVVRTMVKGFQTGTRIGIPSVGSVGNLGSAAISLLALGSTVVCYEFRTLGLTAFESWLVEARIALFPTVPTVLRYLLPTLASDRIFPDLRCVISSGEPLGWDLVADLRNHLTTDAVVINIFGLTETLAFASIALSSEIPLGDGMVPAGHPLAGTKVEIIDDEGRPLGTGETGEIVVEAPTCALGYWNQDILTKKIFQDRGEAGRRVFTGDLGRFRPDGLLDHLGRIDQQVQIAGNRVEPGEVESVLLTMSGVENAAVLPFTDISGDIRLAAFVIVNDESGLTPHLIRAALSRQLPRVMIPASIDEVLEIPLLPSGKVDRLRLLEHRSEHSSDSSDAEARSDVEERLVHIWSRGLDVRHVGLDDDFFELGGDSMRAARIFAEMERQLDVELPLSVLVEHPTIRKLAMAIQDQQPNVDCLVPIQLEGSKPPLFVIHAQHGDVIFARELSDVIGKDVPVYGLRAESLDRRTPLHGTVPELAAYFNSLIRSVHPDGPYCLYGWSLGGLIAFEMACQLQSSGAEVSLLALGDTALPNLGLPPDPSNRDVRDRKLRQHRERLQSLNTPGKAGYFLRLFGRQVDWQVRKRTGPMWKKVTGAHRRETEAWRSAQEAIERGEPAPPNAKLEYVQMQTVNVVMGYKPESRFTGSVLFFRAYDSFAERGWDSMVTGNVVLHDIPAEHMNFRLEAGRNAIGAYLSDAICSIVSI